MVSTHMHTHTQLSLTQTMYVCMYAYTNNFCILIFNITKERLHKGIENAPCSILPNTK